MEAFSKQCVVFLLLVFVSRVMSDIPRQTLTCRNRGGPCFLKKNITCPYQCPKVVPDVPTEKGCYLDCNSPICKAVCRNRKPDCKTPGAVCFDPRFIGGDGIVFYFHGKSQEHFSLISDQNLQINARFIGHRPEGRSRDYTWVQALGLMFESHTFIVEAKKVAKWADKIDQLQFSYDDKALEIGEGYPSNWKSDDEELIVERTSNANSVIITLVEFVEISINVVPITEQDDKIHNYKIPSDDCFAHLEVQFRFFGLSPDVEGVLGRTYRPDFKNPAKAGVAMAVVGGEDKYRTTSLVDANCRSCIFSPAGVEVKEISSLLRDFGTLDCSRGVDGRNGIVCRK